jgi:hypothetical protein
VTLKENRSADRKVTANEDEDGEANVRGSGLGYFDSLNNY